MIPLGERLEVEFLQGLAKIARVPTKGHMKVSCSNKNCNKCIEKEKALSFYDVEGWKRYACDEKCRLKAMIEIFSVSAENYEKAQLVLV